MTSDKILSSILGDRLGYVRKKGYGKNPPKRSQTQQTNIEANMSSAIESMRQEMQLDMERKLQEKREQIATVLKRDMDQDFQKKLEEEREHMKGEVEKYFKKKWLLAWLECNRYSSNTALKFQHIHFHFSPFLSQILSPGCGILKILFPLCHNASGHFPLEQANMVPAVLGK
ncbi:putative formin-like protein 3-like [Capsicum annuum]|nr:putative formin-like protein 3-like [Capsicum annuum]